MRLGDSLKTGAARVGLRLVARYGRWADGARSSAACSRTEIFDALLSAGEYGRFIVPLIRLYFAYFDRPPDHAGLSHWIERHAHGVTLDAVARSFSDSPEFARRCARHDDASFVLAIFRSMFGRDPGRRRRAPWVRELQDGRVTRGELVRAFACSPDFHAHVDSEVHAAVMFLFLLRRTPDPAGFVHWVEAHRRGATPIERLLHSDEFRERWLAANAPSAEG